MKELNDTVIIKLHLLPFIIHVNQVSQDHSYKNKNTDEIVVEPSFILVIINIQIRRHKKDHLSL